MDLGGNLLLILAIMGLILLQFFLRKGYRPERTHPEVVQNLLTDVKLNLALVEIFHLPKKPKKFEVNSWQRNKTRINFLAQSLKSALSEVFVMAEDFNRQIDMAKRSKSANHTVNIDVDKLKEPLTRSKQGLEEWLLINIGAKRLPPKYPSIIDSLFGGGGY